MSIAISGRGIFWTGSDLPDSASDSAGCPASALYPGDPCIYRRVLIPVRANATGLPAWLYVVGDRWAVGCKEDKAGWSGFLAYLKKRGLSCPELFISDKCLGLLESLAEYYPNAQWQRCTVHWYRNVLSVVPRGRMKEVAAKLKAIHAQEDAAAAGTQWGLKRYMNMDRLKEMKRQQQEKQEVMAG